VGLAATGLVPHPASAIPNASTAIPKMTSVARSIGVDFRSKKLAHRNTLKSGDGNESTCATEGRGDRAFRGAFAGQGSALSLGSPPFLRLGPRQRTQSKAAHNDNTKSRYHDNDADLSHD
jgi:hypothetical protein